MANTQTSRSVHRHSQILSGSLWTGLAVVLAGAAWRGLPGMPLWPLAALTLFVAAVVATFSLRYMRADGRRSAFNGLLAILAASALAFVLTDNLAIFAAAWVTSGLLLARLVAHGSSCADAEAAGSRSRRAFLAGDSALVLGLALIASHAGSLDFDTVRAAATTMPATTATAAALLLLVAAAARCALPPFSGWLLSSMTAPTPVSALMHAGLVNAGGILLLRFAPVLEAAPAARLAAVGLGLSAAIYGIGVMVVRPDVKRSLAGSTVSQMGFMIMSCGLGAYAAALWHLVAHSLFKAWLFLGSGSAVGTRRKPAVLPPTWAVATIAAGTLAAGLLLIRQGGDAASLLPLLLAFATALALAVSAWSGEGESGGKLLPLLGLAGLAILHGFGFSLAQTTVGQDAASPVPAALLAGLLAAFLGCWVWQQSMLARKTPLPAALYVRLLNAGALQPAQGVA